MYRNLNYVAEINLPNDSAYSIHVMKMCEAFSELNFKVNLLPISSNKTKSVLNKYNVKKKLKIFPVFKKKIDFNFFWRVIFSIKIILKYKNDIYLSRSIIFALIASIFNRIIILELHHEITGISKFIYNFLKYFGMLNKLNYIFLHKNLAKKYKINKQKFIILDDAVSINEFENIKKKKIHKNTCVYVGSFYKGKGADFIFQLAKKNPKINFHLYGNSFNLNTDLKNVKLYGHKPYNCIPSILSKYEVALMPYSKKVKGKSTIQIGNYMSPLKMFDYLASKKIIIASDLSVYKHVLKDKFNSLLVEVNNTFKWSLVINEIFQNPEKYEYLKLKAFETAKKNSWKNRAKKILKKFNSYFLYEY